MHHEQIKQQICDIGRRLYDRGLVVAADGNISVRVAENEILCTPTGQSKGQMQPSDICTVDLDGNQTGGQKQPSSEVRLHLEVYRRRDDVQSVVHAHPPHATAFALTREAIPTGVLPEVELFLGEVPTAPYATPGTDELPQSIVPFVEKSNIIVLANHGTVSYDANLERALWWTEILENYCRVLILSQSVGTPAYLTNAQIREVLSTKAKWGLFDPRTDEDFANCDLLKNPLFRDSWTADGTGRRRFLPPEDESRRG